MNYLIGIDVGTSSSKAIIIDESGCLVAEASSQYPISSPQPDWAEQNPEWWWEAVKKAIEKALNCSKIDPKEVSAVGLSGQMHGTILLDRNSKPLRPAVIWADKRSQAQCREIYEKIGTEKFLDVTCNRAMPGFMASSLLWIKENEPAVFEKASTILLPKDYIRFKLTGSLATDVSDASATLLFDVKKRRWSDYVISRLGFPLELFPEIYQSVEVVSEVSREASKETTMPRGIKVIAGGGDSPVGAIGCGAIKPEIVTSNIGTAGQIFATLNEIKFDTSFRIHTFCHAAPKKWYLQGAILSAGLSLRWLIESLISENASEIEDADLYETILKEAESVEPGCEGLIFLPYLLGERSPHMDPQARGALFGLTLAHEKSHIVRAVMEGVVYALRDSLEIFRELGVRVKSVVARGGGARSRLWRQIQADIFNSEVISVKVKEEAAFGAALLAGVGAGIYGDLEDAVNETVKVAAKDHPNPERVEVYNQHYRRIYRKLYPSLKSFFNLSESLSR